MIGSTKNNKELLQQIYNLLRNRFGYLNWWPGDTPFEVMVGAILTQNTSWTNVEKAIDNLKKTGILSPKRILDLSSRISSSDEDNLSRLIKPSGYYNQKARRLRELSQWVINRCQGDLSTLQSVSTPDLREELLDINGIGLETADSILLYAFNRPVFVIDAYTRRIISRMGICDVDIKYKDLQELFVQNLDRDVELYNDFHAQIVALGKYHCKPKPLCGTCPLMGFCEFYRKTQRSKK